MTGAQYAALLGLWIAGIVVPGPDVFVILRNAFLSSRRNAVFTALGVMLGNLAWITLSLLGVTVLISGNHVLKLVVQVGGALFLARMGYGAVRAGMASRARGSSPADPGGGTVGPAASGADAAPGPTDGTSPRRGDPGLDAPRGRGDGVSFAGGVADEQRVLTADTILEHEIAAQGRGRFMGPSHLSPWRSLAQGTLTNLANAKAVVFFVALFGSVVPADIGWVDGLTVLGSLVVVGLAWFAGVAWLGSVPALARRFQARTAEVEIVSGVVFLVVAAALLVEALLAA